MQKDISLYPWIAVICIMVQACNGDQRAKSTQPVSIQALDDKLLAPSSGQVKKMEGRIGDYLDQIMERRILSNFAKDDIIPEATETYRQRQDDQFHEGRGRWQGEFWGK